MNIPMSAVGLLALAGAALTAPAQAQSDFFPFQLLVGEWEGTGEGFGSTSEVHHKWEFVLQNKFLRLSTRSIATTENGSQEIHEDIGYLSFDGDNGTWVFRHFLSEGYVNTFDIIVRGENADTIEFKHRESESAYGGRAQMHLVFSGSDEYEMILDLADPGADFVACQWMRMKKASGAK